MASDEIQFASTSAYAASLLGGSTAELLRLVKNYLEDQANSVTENPRNNRFRGAGALHSDQITGQLVEVLRQESPKIKRFRDRSRGTIAEHEWAKVTLIGPRIVTLGPLATMIITERTEIRYRYAKSSTFYSVGHKFFFVRSDGKWKIANDMLDEDPSGVEPLPYDRRVFLRAKGLVDRFSPDLGERLDPQDIETPESALGGAAGIHLSAYTDFLAAPPGPAPYNGNAAADYAERWSSGGTTFNHLFGGRRNGDYAAYGNDCTNFASQALRAGGWRDDQPRGCYAKRGTAIGAAEKGLSPDSDTGPAWRLADSLMRYGRDVSHRFAPFNGSRSRRGDIFFADWDDANGNYGNDGHIDHSMVVTRPGSGKDWRDVRVTYRSSDQLNIMIADVAAKQAHGRDESLMRFYFMHVVAG